MAVPRQETPATPSERPGPARQSADNTLFATGSELEFGHSSGVAEGIGDALAESWREFRSVDGPPAHGKALLTPDCPSHGCEAVGKGRPLLLVPGAGRDLDPGTAVEA